MLFTVKGTYTHLVPLGRLPEGSSSSRLSSSSSAGASSHILLHLAACRIVRRRLGGLPLLRGRWGFPVRALRRPPLPLHPNLLLAALPDFLLASLVNFLFFGGLLVWYDGLLLYMVLGFVEHLGSLGRFCRNIACRARDPPPLRQLTGY